MANLNSRHGCRAGLALAAAGALFVTACGTGGEITPADVQTTQVATPVDERLDTSATVHVRLTLEPTSLNIFTTAGAALDQLLLDNVYQGLVSVDTAAGGRIVPALAKSWEQSPDGLTYTFHLVTNAKFHDGTPLTAADAVWSLQQQIAPGSSSIDAAALDSVAEVTAPDPATVRIQLKQRDTLLLPNLTRRGGIVYRKGTDFASLDGTANGSGPFELVGWNRGSSITLTRNVEYWGAKPKIAEVILHYIADRNSANNAQLTGRTDIQVAADPTLLQPFTGNDEFTVLRGTTTDKYTLAFNGKQAPFTNPDVRHAIRQAIDREALIGAYGAGLPIGSNVPPQDPWYEDLTGIDAHDPENAKKLLAEAGFANGLALILDIPNVYPTAITDLVVSDLTKVGITVTVRQLEFQTWLSKVYSGRDFQLSLVDHAEARDLDNYIKPGYYFGYDNPQVRQWYTEARTAVSEADRDVLLKKVARQISVDAAADWLFLIQSTTVVRAGVYGVPLHETSNRYNLSTLAVGR